MKKHLVYKVTLSNGSVYYGRTTNLRVRMNNHKYKGYNGLKMLSYEIVKDNLTKQEADNLEYSLIRNNDCVNKEKKIDNINFMEVDEILEKYDLV